MYTQGSTARPVAPGGASSSMSPPPSARQQFGPPCRFLPAHPPSPARLRLFCFPHAGGGTALFDAWPAAFPAGVEVCPVYLPGRERRIWERPLAQLLPLVEMLANDLLPWLNIPFAFFGHSMGALVGFELARHLRQIQGPQPIHLFVSACRPPHLPRGAHLIHHLSRQEFIEELRRLGIAAEVLHNAELLELVLPMLYADIAACETYVYQAKEPLGCSITAFGGTQDRSVEPLSAWSIHTRQTCSCVLLPGDHFYVQSAQPLLLRYLAEELVALLHTAQAMPRPAPGE